jgi:adenylate cyclase class 2
MQVMETEVKIRLADRDSFERKLSDLGFRRVTARTFERNTLYDTPERRLRNSRQILRIRQYGEKWTVTHKSVPEDSSPDERHKRRVETETVVQDGEALGKIFETLGFSPVFIYEKWRAEWADDVGHCVLDETPLGLYAELEGPGDWIDSVAAKLNIDESRFIQLSYGRIFEKWKAESNLNVDAVEHMTFADIPPAYRLGG